MVTLFLLAVFGFGKDGNEFYGTGVDGKLFEDLEVVDGM